MIGAALLAADLASTFDVSDQTGVRARVTLQPSQPGSGAGLAHSEGLDLYTQPQAKLGAVGRGWGASLGYAPLLALPDIESEVSVELFHNGSASVAWHDRLVRVALSEAASYGQYDSRLLPQVASQAGQMAVPPVAVSKTIHFGSSYTDLALGTRASRRVTLGLDGGYQLSGGVDADSRAVLPEQYGPRAGASVDYAISRRDSVTTSASALHTDFTIAPCPPAPGQTGTSTTLCAPQANLVQTGAALRHLLSPAAAWSTAAGVAVSYSRLSHDDPYGFSMYPTAGAAFSQRFGSRGASALEVTAALAPIVDVRTGVVNNRVQGTALLTDHLTASVLLNVNAGVAQTVPATALSAVSVISGGLDAAFRLSRQVDINLGDQTLWQDQSGYGIFVSTFGFVGVTVREPTLHF